VENLETVAVATCKAYLRFRESHCREPSRTAKCRKERGLAKWIQNRVSIKRATKEHSSYVSVLVKRMLEDSLGKGWWNVENLETVAVATCKAYLRFRESHCREPSRTAKCRKERGLAKWDQITV
jgi:hypothetical protein